MNFLLKRNEILMRKNVIAFVFKISTLSQKVCFLDNAYNIIVKIFYFVRGKESVSKHTEVVQIKDFLFWKAWRRN